MDLSIVANFIRIIEGFGKLDFSHSLIMLSPNRFSISNWLVMNAITTYYFSLYSSGDIINAGRFFVVFKLVKGKGIKIISHFL